MFHLFTLFDDFFSFTVLFIFLSLLLGVDEEKKQIACGLVDTIGTKGTLCCDTTRN